jgi:hypothetical protein
VKPTIRPVLCLVCARVWLEVLSSGIVAADPKEPSQSIELPRRISSGPPPVAPPPAVPAAADSLPPLTFSVTTTWQSPDGRRGRARQTVMRTVDRILLGPPFDPAATRRSTRLPRLGPPRRTGGDHALPEPCVSLDSVDGLDDLGAVSSVRFPPASATCPRCLRVMEGRVVIVPTCQRRPVRAASHKRFSSHRRSNQSATMRA